LVVEFWCLFFHSSNVLAVLVHSVTVQRGADAEKKLEGITQIVSVIAVETIRAIVDRKLGAESDVEAVAMRQIADISNRVSAYRKDARFIRGIQNELVTRFFYTFPARVYRVAPSLIIRFDQERLRFALAGSVVLAPDKCVRPVSIGTKRVDCKSPRLSCDELWSQGGAFRDF